MKNLKIKKLFVDIQPTPRPDIQVSDLTPQLMDELAFRPSFDYSHNINLCDAVDVVMMVYTHRMKQEFDRRNIHVEVALSPSFHTNYPGWLMLISVDDPTINITPLIAKYFRWNRQETQNVMTEDDLFDL